MKPLLEQIRHCSVCAPFLPHGVRPVIAASPTSRILVIGHAPGRIVHATGIPWDDKSGDNLRSWLGMEKAVFYDPSVVALVGMGFCYPGTGKSGDLPPRPECAPLWHRSVLAAMPRVQLTLLIGRYAQDYYLRDAAHKTLTETVRRYSDYLPKYFVLPHPSPRNNLWQAKNEWFAQEALPELKREVRTILANP